MRNLFVALFVLAIVASTRAEVAYFPPTGPVFYGTPASVEMPDGRTQYRPTDAHLTEAGWTRFEADLPCAIHLGVVDYTAKTIRCKTEAEMQAEADARAAEQAAEAALRGPEPEVFVPLVNDSMERIGTARIVVLAGSMVVLASTNSASPQKDWTDQKAQLLSIAESRTMKDSKLAEASAFTDEKAKKEAAAKLEAIAAESAGKKRTVEQRLDLLEKIAGLKDAVK